MTAGLAARRSPCSRLQILGLPSCATLSCCAWKTGADHPWPARSPGQGSTGPLASLRLTHGKPVRRTLDFSRLTHPRTTGSFLCVPKARNRKKGHPGLCARKPRGFPRSAFVSDGPRKGHPWPWPGRARSLSRPCGRVLRLRASLGLSKGTKSTATAPCPRRLWPCLGLGLTKGPKKINPTLPYAGPSLGGEILSWQRVNGSGAAGSNSTESSGFAPNLPEIAPPRDIDDRQLSCRTAGGVRNSGRRALIALYW